MKYFVCFCYEEDRKVNFGNTVINTDDGVSTKEVVRENRKALISQISKVIKGQG